MLVLHVNMVVICTYFIQKRVRRVNLWHNFIFCCGMEMCVMIN